MAYNLDVHGIDLIPTEGLPLHMGVYQFKQRIVHNILVLMVIRIIQMDMAVGVHIKIHLVVGTHPMFVESHQRQSAQDIVNGSDRDLDLSLGNNIFSDHIGAGMHKLQHCLMDRNTLRGRLQRIGLEDLLEPLYVRWSLLIVGHRLNFSTDKGRRRAILDFDFNIISGLVLSIPEHTHLV